MFVEKVFCELSEQLTGEIDRGLHSALIKSDRQYYLSGTVIVLMQMFFERMHMTAIRANEKAAITVMVPQSSSWELLQAAAVAKWAHSLK